KELAPKEDQGVIFGIITAPANATIDDTIRYADAAGKIFQDIPDTRFTFQLTFPDNGFGGMVLKPWGVRKTPTKAYLPQIQAKLGAIPGIQMFPIMPSALPGADNFPVSFYNLGKNKKKPPSRNRRLFSITIRSRRSVSTCSKWAPISRPASAAIMSTGSTLKGAVTK